MALCVLVCVCIDASHGWLIDLSLVLRLVSETDEEMA